MLIAEMTLYYKENGKTLYEALLSLYEKYGFFKEELVSIELHVKEGQEKIASCIDALRNSTIKEVAGTKVVKKYDYKLSKENDMVSNTVSDINLPKSNVLKFILDNGSSFVVRPSGTEPKMKVYLAVRGNSLSDSETQIAKFKESVMELINKNLK